jgi:hypothetical protein
MVTPEVFISYAWRDESLKVTEALDVFFQTNGIMVIRDNRDIGYRGLIKEYMQRLGRGKYVVVVLSDQYFKSKSCMYELMQLSQHEDFYDRIFPVTVEGTSIYEAEDALQYTNYWDEKVEQLQAQIKNAKNIANLQGITDDLNLYVEIRQNIAKLIDFLRNINTHPLRGSNFDPLFETIQAKIQQDQEEPNAAISPEKQASAAVIDQEEAVVVVSGEGRRWACLIGTNEYDDPELPSLSYPEENVDALTRLLEDKQIGDFDHVMVLKGRTNTEVIQEIKRISKQLNVDDLLLLYFSGYALLDGEETEKLYLVAKGTDPADLPGSAIDLARIKTFLDSSKALQKILILDCHYGGQSPPYQMNDPETIKEQIHVKGKGIYIISNPLETEESKTFIDKEEPHSLFTKYLIEGITTGKADLDGSGKVTLEEWYTYLQRQMTDRGLSEPLRWNEGVAGTWIVSRTAGALFEPEVNGGAEVAVEDKAAKTLFTIVSIFLPLESLNALSAVQNWEVTVPSFINFQNIKNNWGATQYAIIVIFPTLIVMLILGLYYARRYQMAPWSERILTPLKVDIDSSLSLGKTLKLCIIFLAIIIPLLTELFLTHKFFYGTVYKNGEPFSCGYFTPQKCYGNNHSFYDNVKRGHLQYVSVSFEEIKTRQFTYGQEGVDYIPFWIPWLLLVFNFGLLILFSFYTYSIFKHPKVKQA